MNILLPFCLETKCVWACMKHWPTLDITTLYNFECFLLSFCTEQYGSICGTLARAKIFLLDIAVAQRGSYLSFSTYLRKNRVLVLKNMNSKEKFFHPHFIQREDIFIRHSCGSMRLIFVHGIYLWRASLSFEEIWILRKNFRFPTLSRAKIFLWDIPVAQQGSPSLYLSLLFVYEDRI